MRTWMRLRLARIQPNTASQTIRKRDSSSVQISGSPNARVDDAERHAAEQRGHERAADERGGLVEAAGETRSIGIRLRGGDTASRRAAAICGRYAIKYAAMRSQRPLPHFDSNLAGSAGQHGLAEALDVGLDHRHAAGLERVGELALLRQDFVVLRLRRASRSRT